MKPAALFSKLKIVLMSTVVGLYLIAFFADLAEVAKDFLDRYAHGEIIASLLVTVWIIGAVLVGAITHKRLKPSYLFVPNDMPVIFVYFYLTMSELIYDLATGRSALIQVIKDW